jgi:pSer/pThr/pTyr-binding forkhead associated (FHA) protein
MVNGFHKLGMVFATLLLRGIDTVLFRGIRSFRLAGFQVPEAEAGIPGAMRATMIRLTIKLNGSVVGKMETAADEISIGRDEDNSLHIDNAAVSGKHARIINDHTEYILEDRGSTNGTYVNEEKVTRRVLHQGDVIAIGEFLMEVSLEESGAQGFDHNIGDPGRTQRLGADLQQKIFKDVFGQEQ